MGVLGNLKISIPDIITQRIIVAQIEAEQLLINANMKLIRIFEDKIKSTISHLWGKAE